MKTTLITLVVGMALMMGVSRAIGATNYVDANHTGGSGSGDSWANAFTNLQNALSVAGSGQVWVAEGVYYPTNGTDRTATFQLAAGVSVYGGFTNGMGALGERDWTNHATILSGNIGNPATSTDNCYHVVSGTNGTTLDGFTVTGGKADGTAPNNYGGGMYNNLGNNSTVRNCTFVSNAAAYGGGMMYLSTTGPQSTNWVIETCVFRANSATTAGGGIYTYADSWTMRDCTFASNSATTATADGGGVYNWNGDTWTMTNCRFTANSAADEGGGVHNIYGGRWLVKDCTFVANSGASGGGLLTRTHYTGDNTIEGCTFSGNAATNLYGGGIALLARDATGSGDYVVTNCLFNNNTALTFSGGAHGQDSSGILKIYNCAFLGNSSGSQGGGMYNIQTNLMRNCLFAGNQAGADGGGHMQRKYSISAANSTFSGNKSTAGLDGGGISIQANAGETPVFGITNCIIWDNYLREMTVNGAGCTGTVSYTDIEGGTGAIYQVNSPTVAFGGGNINTNPAFGGGPTGTWTTGATYDAGAGQSLLIDAGAAWLTNELAGKSLNPQTNQTFQFYIISNAATSITVWGNAATLGTNGAAYRVHDYHLKSLSGRWTANGWVADLVHSPGIDAGDPVFSYALEPRPNGKRINLGAYGNTEEASKANIPRGTLFGFR